MPISLGYDPQVEGRDSAARWKRCRGRRNAKRRRARSEWTDRDAALVRGGKQAGIVGGKKCSELDGCLFPRCFGEVGQGDDVQFCCSGDASTAATLFDPRRETTGRGRTGQNNAGAGGRGDE